MKKYKHIPTGEIATKNTACHPYDYTCGSHIAAWIIEHPDSKDWEEIIEPLAILSVKNCYGYEFKIGDKTSKGMITEFKLIENGIEAVLNSETPVNFNINELEKK